MVTPAPLQERCGQVALADRVETSEGFDGRWGRRGGEEERGEGQAANCAPLLFSALIIWSATLSEENFPCCFYHIRIYHCL